MSAQQDRAPRRLAVEDLFPNGHPIGDTALGLKVEAAFRREFETGYAEATREEMLQHPEAVTLVGSRDRGYFPLLIQFERDPAPKVFDPWYDRERYRAEAADERCAERAEALRERDL